MIRLVNDFDKSPGILGRFCNDRFLCRLYNFSIVIGTTAFASPLLGALALTLAVKDDKFLSHQSNSEKLLSGSPEPIAALTSAVEVLPAIDDEAIVFDDMDLGLDLSPLIHPHVGVSSTATPTNARELLKRLESECPELLLLVKSAPIRLVGKQRTGKSTFAKKLALLRTVLLPGHTVAWSTPHREADNPVPETLNPFGTTSDGAKDYRAIESVWKATQEVIDKGQQLNLTITWDEFGSYDNFQDTSALGKSLRSLLREATKHGYFPILIAHGDQASFYPGIAGILTTLKESTIKVETVGEIANAFGEMQPTGFVEVTQLDGSQSRFKVPDWLTVDLLLSLQPAATKPALLDAITSVKSVPSAIKTPVETKQPEQFKAVDVSSSSADQTIKRVGLKLAEKLKSVNGEWISLRELVTRNFSRDEDREIAKQLITKSIQSGKLEYKERENSNKTKSVVVRVKSSA